MFYWRPWDDRFFFFLQILGIIKCKIWPVGRGLTHIIFSTLWSSVGQEQQPHILPRSNINSFTRTIDVLRFFLKNVMYEELGYPCYLCIMYKHISCSSPKDHVYDVHKKVVVTERIAYGSTELAFAYKWPLNISSHTHWITLTDTLWTWHLFYFFYFVQWELTSDQNVLLQLKRLKRPVTSACIGI